MAPAARKCPLGRDAIRGPEPWGGPMPAGRQFALAAAGRHRPDSRRAQSLRRRGRCSPAPLRSGPSRRPQAAYLAYPGNRVPRLPPSFMTPAFPAAPGTSAATSIRAAAAGALPLFRDVRSWRSPDQAFACGVLGTLRPRHEVGWCERAPAGERLRMHDIWCDDTSSGMRANMRKDGAGHPGRPTAL